MTDHRDISTVTPHRKSSDTESIKVLMYHRIFDPLNGTMRDRGISVPKNIFRSHLRTIERLGFTTITFEDYDLHIQGRLPLPKKPIILTFDDGYLDTLEIAVPLLREFGMKAVVFIVGDPKITTNSWDENEDITPARLMTPDQIVELHAAGMEIGSHSMTHPHLTTIPREQAWEEIQRSRMLLEILLNTPVRTFAYPYGDLNPEVRHLVIEAGYRFACGVFSGPPSIGKDHFNIRRISPAVSLDPIAFGLQLTAPVEYLLWFGRKVKNLLGRDMRNPAAVDRGIGN